MLWRRTCCRVGWEPVNIVVDGRFWPCLWMPFDSPQKSVCPSVPSLLTRGFQPRAQLSCLLMPEGHIPSRCWGCAHKQPQTSNCPELSRAALTQFVSSLVFGGRCSKNVEIYPNLKPGRQMAVYLPVCSNHSL